MRRSSLKRACVAFVVLLALASGTAAQIPTKKKNLTRADREAWFKILRWPDKYEEAWRKTQAVYVESYSGLEFYDLGRGKYLVEVQIYEGAYQASYVYMLYDEKNEPNGPGRLLLLKGFESRDASGRPLSYSEVPAGLTTFNAKTKVLEIYSKYRANGDCGLFVRYRFVGARPLVIEARGQDCEDGGRRADQRDPYRWPRKKL